MKKLFCIFLLLSVLCSSIPPVYASDDSIMPRWENTNFYNFSFTIDNDGVADALVQYYGQSESFSYVKLTLKIQKRFLGMFWNTVDIGETDNQWIEYSYTTNGNFYNSFQLSDTGTYRALLTLEVFGSNNSVDVIEDQVEREYK